MSEPPNPFRVRTMFNALAPRYDRLNAIFSLGRDRAWRRTAARLAGLQPGDIALDLCTGTGELARALAAHVRPGGRVIGLDFSEGMLAHARPAPDVAYLLSDATPLPYPDRSFDAVTIGFGLRNVADRMAVLSEMRRVLRVGKPAVVLEFSRPPPGGLNRAYRLYLGRIMPALAAIGNPSAGQAYRYLSDSIRSFPSPTALAQEMEGAGFRQVELRSMSFGIVSLHRGLRE